MDLISHALWAYIAFKAYALKTGKRIKILQTMVWTIMPDAFSFGLVSVAMLYGFISGNPVFPQPGGIEHAEIHQTPIFQLASFMYNITHSAFIFLIFFLLFLLIYRRPIYAMLGWLFHIVIDMPTHSNEFFPTPIFWPISTLKINGISWNTAPFMIANTMLLITAFIIFLRWKKIFQKR